MDWGAIPELANHFVQAAGHITQAAGALYSSIPDMLPQSVVDLGDNVWTGITAPDAMSTGQKVFQAFKFGTATITLGASILLESPAGIASSMIAEGEVITEFSRAGESYKKAHGPAP